MPYRSTMAIMGELTNQGRVIGGQFANGTVSVDGRGGGLLIVNPRNPFKKPRVNSETITEWEELEGKRGVVGTLGQVAASAVLPGRLGKAVGAGLGALGSTGHTVRVTWTDGNNSVLELPEKLFQVLSVLLSDLRVVTPNSLVAPTDPVSPPDSVTNRLVDLASSVVSHRTNQAPRAAEDPAVDVTEQIRKLAALHEAGILTNEEFTTKKAALLDRM